MNIYQLRDTLNQEIIDYAQLKDALKAYSQPRKKISSWLAQKKLIRIKKGLYIFGSSVSKNTYSLEHLANLIYGPSAISLSYALSYYQLIPERVHTITSITCKKNKLFETPIGCFTYQYLNYQKYSVGLQLIPQGNQPNILIATPEKALCDFITLNAKGIRFDSPQTMKEFLLDDLRIEKISLQSMDFNLMTKLSEVYQHKQLKNFLRYFMEWMQ